MGNYVIVIYFVLFSLVGSANYYISRRHADKNSHTIPGSANHLGLLLGMYWKLILVEVVAVSIYIAM